MCRLHNSSCSWTVPTQQPQAPKTKHLEVRATRGYTATSGFVVCNVDVSTLFPTMNVSGVKAGWGNSIDTYLYKKLQSKVCALSFWFLLQPSGTTPWKFCRKSVLSLLKKEKQRYSILHVFANTFFAICNVKCYGM